MDSMRKFRKGVSEGKCVLKTSSVHCSGMLEVWKYIVAIFTFKLHSSVGAKLLFFIPLLSTDQPLLNHTAKYQIAGKLSLSNYLAKLSKVKSR